MEQRDIRGRSREINRAWGILQELAGSLDHAEGGEISRRLAGLYTYMQARLIEANAKQSARRSRRWKACWLTLVEAWQPAMAAAHRRAGAEREHGYDAALTVG